jgi:hypothetical protein
MFFITGKTINMYCGQFGVQTEAPCLMKRNNLYYVLYSNPNCGYCATGTSYKTAASPLVPWSGGTKISVNSCGGQPSMECNTTTKRPILQVARFTALTAARISVWKTKKVLARHIKDAGSHFHTAGCFTQPVVIGLFPIYSRAQYKKTACK